MHLVCVGGGRRGAYVERCTDDQLLCENNKTSPKSESVVICYDYQNGITADVIGD